MKKIFAVILSALILTTGIGFGEALTGANILTVSAAAAAIPITENEVARIESTWNKYPYILYWGGNNSSQGRQAVKYLQRLLNVVYSNDMLDEDGIIGAKTYAQICGYQRSRGLAVDGLVGSMTKNSLIADAKKLIASNSVNNNPSASVSLDKAKALDYANKYWNARNPAYTNHYDNNCAAFCSQILVASGLKTDSTWKDNSYAFKNVKGLRDYITKTYSVEYIMYPSADQIEPHDIIFAGSELSHVMYCTSKAGGYVRASGNSNNRNNMVVSTGYINAVLKTSKLFK